MGSEEVKIERRKRSCKTVNCQGVRLTKAGRVPACKSKL